MAQQFGVPLFGGDRAVLAGLRLRLGPGRLVFLTGPSGCGKSTALGVIARLLPEARTVEGGTFPPRRSIVDAVCPHEPVGQALELLTACGLGETPTWVRGIDEVSAGQRFRAVLARAIGLHMRNRGAAPLLCDEFCSGLHRRLARAIAFNLRKLVTRHQLNLVLAASDEDFLDDLQPDVTVRLRGAGEAEVIEREPARRAVSLSRRVVIERGCKRDYDGFAAMHYRATDELGFVDKVFVMRERGSGQMLGIVVYSHGPLELALRNQATDNRFLRNATRLNREMRILRRLVVHPDVRGCGLGHRLVRKTLPLVGTPYVECLATMGSFNPVFEKAGMKRVGTCAMPANRKAILDELRAMGVDPFARAFVTQVSRKPRVRRLVARLVYQWYQATTAGGENRVERQSPQLLAQTFRGLVGSQPVYFLWRRPRRRQRRKPKGGIGQGRGVGGR